MERENQGSSENLKSHSGVEHKIVGRSHSGTDHKLMNDSQQEFQTSESHPDSRRLRPRSINQREEYPYSGQQRGGRAI